MIFGPQHFYARYSVKLRANRCTALLDVTCCIHLHTLLHACCWELLCKVWNWSNFWAKNSQHFFCSVIALRVAQQCWIHLHSSFQHCWGRARTSQMVYKVLWVVSFPWCTVGSFCIHLHTSAKTDATTPNIVGPTVLGVAASICK